MRRVLKCVLALSAVPVLASSAFAESFTTRIEPRPYYGATVTIEEGVRVFRPLPPVRHVIVNPNGATPLSLSYNDTRVYEESHNYNYNHDSYGGGSYGRSYGFGSFGFGKHRGGFHKPRRGGLGVFKKHGHH
jgi:hypothetical protein